MSHDQSTQDTPHKPFHARFEDVLPRLRGMMLELPEIRVAYFHPGPADAQLSLSGPDRARVVIVFTHNVSNEHIDKRLHRFRRLFKPLVAEEVVFQSMENLEYREACEIAFNARPIFGSLEAVERDRLYRYHVFLEWNSGKKITGNKQEQPPVLLPPLDAPAQVVDVSKFITPIYRHLKLIESHLRELGRLSKREMQEFEADGALKSMAESYLLKSIQSAILITMSVMHRKIRLNARDYRDLFLLMPVYGLTHRERAARLAKCAEVRDRLMFQYEDVSAMDVYKYLFEVSDAMRDFKSFMLEWLFEQYYAPTGELIQNE